VFSGFPIINPGVHYGTPSIILKWNSAEQDVKAWTGFNWTEVAQNRSGGRTFVNVIIDISIRRAQVKVGLINLCKGLFSLNARIYYKLKSGT
jgi:hypothetical protein